MFISLFRYQLIDDDDDDDDVIICKICACACCLICSFVLMVILISIIIGLCFTTGKSYSNYDYGPADTRLFNFSKSFCQSLSLEATYSSTNEYNISFYMLSSNPGLFAQENFSIQEKIIIAEGAQYYLFYMHSGSEVTVSACFLDSGRPYST